MKPCAILIIVIKHTAHRKRGNTMRDVKFQKANDLNMNDFVQTAIYAILVDDLDVGLLEVPMIAEITDETPDSANVHVTTENSAQSYILDFRMRVILLEEAQEILIDVYNTNADKSIIFVPVDDLESATINYYK